MGRKPKSSLSYTTSMEEYLKLEFQGPYSSPCGGHARYARMASRFARKVTLENLDF